MAEYIARVIWDKITSYRAELKNKYSNDTPLRLPLTDQYGSDQPLLDKLNYNDGLWLFTVPEFSKGSQKRKLAPSLLGRINITHQCNKDLTRIEPALGAPNDIKPKDYNHMLSVAEGYTYWRCGIPGCALPIHNAFFLFKNLTFNGRVKQIDPNCERCNTSETPKSGPFGHLMQHYRSIRRLSKKSVKQLKNLYEHVENRRTLFFSYKRIETGSLVEKVAEYLRNDALCWWDIQDIPQEKFYGDSLLTDLLKNGIRQARWFIAFLSSEYAKRGWTFDEFEIAKTFSSDNNLKHRPEIVPVILGGKEIEYPNVQPIQKGENARAIALEIKRRISDSSTTSD